MAIPKKNADPFVEQILATLTAEYQAVHPGARIDVYRYNPACILVRVIDPRYRGTHFTERGDDVWELLRQRLPEEVYCDIALLLLLTPEETETSDANWEFDNPTWTPGALVGSGKPSPALRRKPRGKHAS